MADNELNEGEKAVVTISRSIAILSLVIIVIMGILISLFLNPAGNTPEAERKLSQQQEKTTVGLPPNNAKQDKNGPVSSLWTSPQITDIPEGEEGEGIKYGRELIAHTAKYLGPKGTVASISNGMNCQNCHLDAGTKPWGNNYSAVYSTYPKFRARSGTKESIAKRVNDCFVRSLNGKPLGNNSKEMKAIEAYIKWLGTGINKGETPEGAGLQKLAFLTRAADPKKGAIVFKSKCQSCHGEDGQGVFNPEKTEYVYPPLWGENSYNDGAGLYRLSGFASFVRNNMPLGASHENQQLSNEEAWDVAAFVNSNSRPHIDQSKDWPQLEKKPVDFPFGPYADRFTETQHKYGPFEPIANARKVKK